MAHNPYAMWPQVRTRACASPLRSTRLPLLGSRPGSLSRPALTSYLLSPPQTMMNPYGTAGQVMYPGYMVRLPLSRFRTREWPLAVSMRFRAARPRKKEQTHGALGEETTRFFSGIRFPRAHERRLTRRFPLPTAGQLRGGDGRRRGQGGWRARRERLRWRRRGALAAAARGGGGGGGGGGGERRRCGACRRLGGDRQRESQDGRSVDGRARAETSASQAV